MTSPTLDDFAAIPLRFRHPLHPREVATGFVSRLAAVNGRELTQLLRHRNISPWDVDRGDEAAIRFVAKIGSADPEQLLRQTIRSTGQDRRWEVVGEPFGPNAINRTYFRFCPHCLIEDMRDVYGPPAARPWLRIEWTLNHYRACHQHHAFLVAAEPTRTRFAPFDFNQTISGMAQDLVDLAAGTVSYRESPYHHWIVERLEGQRDASNWLDHLPLHVGALWCEHLGISALHPPKVLPGKLTQLDRAIASDEGFRIASAGEGAIRELLQKLTDAQRHTRGVIGPRDTYGHAFGLLQRTMDDPAFDSLRAFMRDFARGAMPWKIGTDLLGETITEHAMTTIRTASLKSGASAKTVRKIFERKGIAEKDLEDGLRNHRVLVDTDEIKSLLQKLKGALSTPATARRLGIDRRQLDAIVEAGGLEDIAGADKVHNAQARYAPEDIDAMLVNLLDGAVDVSTPDKRQLGIIDARHAAGCTTAEVLRLVFEKRLRWKGKLVGARGFHSLLLNADEVTAVIRAAAKPFTNLRYCDVPNAIPGLLQKSVEPLARLKQLDLDEEMSPNARRPVPVVTAESVGAFRIKYVTAGELCQTHGLHHKQVKSLLHSVGIDTVFDHEEVHAMVFNRAQVEQASAGKKGFWVYDRLALRRERRSNGGIE